MDGWAKSGVMIRETLRPDAKHVLLAMTPAHGLFSQFRKEDGAWAWDLRQPIENIHAPHWVRLTRQGDTFTLHESSDGAGWQEVGTTNFHMQANVYIGLAVTAHDNARLNAATFDRVVVRADGSARAEIPEESTTIELR